MRDTVRIAQHISKIESLTQTLYYQMSIKRLMSQGKNVTGRDSCDETTKETLDNLSHIFERRPTFDKHGRTSEQLL